MLQRRGSWRRGPTGGAALLGPDAVQDRISAQLTRRFGGSDMRTNVRDLCTTRQMLSVTHPTKHLAHHPHANETSVHHRFTISEVSYGSH